MITEKEIIDILDSYSGYVDRSRTEHAVSEINFELIAKEIFRKLRQPSVSGQCECDFSIESRQGVDFVRCVNCGDTYFKK